MSWSFSLSKNAYKFLELNHLSEDDIFELLKLAIKKLQGEKINLDIKKLKGEWSGFYRIRKGKVRVIVEFDFEEFELFVEVVDFRGGAYK